MGRVVKREDREMRNGREDSRLTRSSAVKRGSTSSSEVGKERSR